MERVPKRGYGLVAEVREVEPGEENGHSRGTISGFGPPGSSSSYHSTNTQTRAAWEAVAPRATSEDHFHPAVSAGRNGLEPRGENSRTRREWLHGLVGGLAIIAVAALLEGTGWKQKLFGGATASPIRSVAVLPLQNLSNDPNQEYFVDGMTDELITDLAQIRELKVVSKTSIMQYKGTHIPLPQIGRELGVDAVIEGSVLRSGDRVRITARLISTATDRHIAPTTSDGDLKDVLS